MAKQRSDRKHEKFKGLATGQPSHNTAPATPSTREMPRRILHKLKPLRGYLTGLVLPGARKSVEPMAALLAPKRVRQTHQSLHHLVADAPWEDEAVLQAVREYIRLRGAASPGD